jgi:hypothetical protein
MCIHVYKCLTRDTAKSQKVPYRIGSMTSTPKDGYENVCYWPGGLYLGEVSNPVALPYDDKMSL